MMRGGSGGNGSTFANNAAMQHRLVQQGLIQLDVLNMAAANGGVPDLNAYGADCHSHSAKVLRQAEFAAAGSTNTPSWPPQVGTVPRHTFRAHPAMRLFPAAPIVLLALQLQLVGCWQLADLLLAECPGCNTSVGVAWCAGQL